MGREGILNEFWSLLILFAVFVVFIVSVVPMGNIVLSIILFSIAIIVFYALIFFPKLRNSYSPQFSLNINDNSAHVRLGHYEYNTVIGQSTGMSSTTTVYKKHYVTFPLNVIRPSKGIATINIACEYCGKPIEILVRSRRRVLLYELIMASSLVFCAIYIFMRFQFADWLTNTQKMDNGLLGIGLFVAIFFAFGVASNLLIDKQHVLDSSDRDHEIFPL